MNTFGKQVTVSIFGESHGAGIGAVISGLPAGFPLDLPEIDRQMARRAPGNSALATLRKETDKVEILSGLFEGKLTGAPLCGIIRNENARSKDYDRALPRPGHADLTAHMKYGGHADYRGGGHFSGRLTAPLVFAGAICRQILKSHGVTIGAHLAAIWKFEDTPFENPTADQLEQLTYSDFPMLNVRMQPTIEDIICSAREQGDSVGGVIECAAVGVPPGLGGPYFDNLEGQIASILYAIPAVKGVEFGTGFGIAKLTGSQANDAIRMVEGVYSTATNHNGGINGGISNGMPLICRVAIKPTPSIFQPQETVCLESGESETLTLQGRHDPCIVPRALPVVEACLAISLLDAYQTGI
ncbi:MAG: chorismate synthase [Oscillospiraceae bacterium]|nr:chorismate synthase [Oscillospiraceae bacterium]